MVFNTLRIVHVAVALLLIALVLVKKSGDPPMGIEGESQTEFGSLSQGSKRFRSDLTIVTSVVALLLISK